MIFADKGAKLKNSVLALGYFDCLHTGHRYLLSRALEIAQINQTTVQAATFNDGIYPLLGRDCPEIYVLEERKILMQRLGAHPLVFPSNEEFLNQSAAEFETYLVSLSPCAVVVGADYRYGKGASGHAERLKSVLKDRGIEAIIVDLLSENGTKISTTDIRRVLLAGDVESAENLLGEPFFMTEKVVGGHQNGRKIGIPTANINFSQYKLLPKEGVYRTMTKIDGKIYPSLTNVGRKPTFEDDQPTVETYILNFSGELYDKVLTVWFKQYIRGIQKFNSANELKAQIQFDIDFCLSR